MTVAPEYSAEIIKIILSMTFTGSIISFFLIILKPFIKSKRYPGYYCLRYFGI